MTVRIKNWIFVTGAPRSGTTFAGLVLSRPWSVDYIHEPFNPDCGIAGIDRRYVYVPSGGEQDDLYRQAVRRLLTYSISLRTAYYKRDTPLKRAAKRVVGSRGPFHLRLARLNPFGRSAVVKDPIGCLLTEFLAREFGFHVLVLLRHPLAFVASTRRLGWDVNAHLADVISQRVLLERYFEAADPILSWRPSDAIDAAALLWRALNKVLLVQAAAVPAVLLRTHESLSINPLGQFRNIFDAFQLPWSNRVRQYVETNTASTNPGEARRNNVQDFSRNSAALLELRVNQIDPVDRRRVFNLVRDIAEPFYSADTFHI